MGKPRQKEPRSLPEVAEDLNLAFWRLIIALPDSSTRRGSEWSWRDAGSCKGTEQEEEAGLQENESRMVHQPTSWDVRSDVEVFSEAAGVFILKHLIWCVIQGACGDMGRCHRCHHRHGGSAIMAAQLHGDSWAKKSWLLPAMSPACSVLLWLLVSFLPSLPFLITCIHPDRRAHLSNRECLLAWSRGRPSEGGITWPQVPGA